MKGIFAVFIFLVLHQLLAAQTGIDGFSPNASGIDNSIALQKALDRTGNVVISQPGIYQLAATVYIGSNTTLICGNGVAATIGANCPNCPAVIVAAKGATKLAEMYCV